MSLALLGEMLREERIRRGLSVEDVAASLKMGARLIRDIEAGNESALPPVYVRGFIRSYGKFLSIDGEALNEGLAGYNPQEPDLTEIEPTVPPGTLHKKIGVLVLALVLFCALGAAGYWVYGALAGQGGISFSTLTDNVKTATSSVMESVGLRDAERVSPMTTAAPLVPTAPVQVEAVPVAAMPNTVETEILESPRVSPSPVVVEIPENAPPVVDASAVVPASDTSVTTFASVSEGIPAVSDEDALAIEEAPVRAEGFNSSRQDLPDMGRRQGTAVTVGGGRQSQSAPEINQLVLTGLAECWVHATADKTDTRQFSIMPGETFSLSFRNDLNIKLGNAGGVRLIYNGAELPPAGKNGQVLTLTFPLAARP